MGNVSCVRRRIASLAAGGALLTGLTLAAFAARALHTRSRAGEGRLASGLATGLALAPVHLSDTGIDTADRLAFSPQYPLWTDGATKRRWISLPSGASIDATDPDAWVFPVGTRRWKEFSFGRRVETRYMERRSDGTWLFATYLWSAEERDAVRADASVVVEPAPGLRHTVPSPADCRACHEGPSPVLGFSALQLSPDRDPRAPHAAVQAGSVDVRALVRRGLLVGAPASLVREPPRIAARSATERAALGYLHGNCGGCHNPRGSLAPLGMSLLHSLRARSGDAPAIATTVGRPSAFPLPGASVGAASVRVAPGRPDRSVLLTRMRAESPLARMPPLGTHLVDRDAVDLIERWITELPDLDDQPVPNERNHPWITPD